jgi:hypothetical protein
LQDDGSICVDACTDTGRFADSTEAMAFVLAQARLGDRLCIKALHEDLLPGCLAQVERPLVEPEASVWTEADQAEAMRVGFRLVADTLDRVMIVNKKDGPFCNDEAAGDYVREWAAKGNALCQKVLHPRLNPGFLIADNTD